MLKRSAQRTPSKGLFTPSKGKLFDVSHYFINVFVFVLCEWTHLHLFVRESQCPITPSHKQCITYQRFSDYRILVCIDWLMIEG